MYFVASFKNKKFILLFVTIVLLVVMGISSIQNNKLTTDIFSTILSPFQRFINFTDKKKMIFCPF